MDGWRCYLKPGILDWLLEEDDPPVRYRTLKDLLDTPEDSGELVNAKAAVMQRGPVPAILGAMRSPEYAGILPRFYKDKYCGLSWQLIILAELGADSANGEIKRHCEYLLAHSQDAESGGFSYDYSKKAGCGLKSGVVPCLTGNMAFSLIRLNMLDDPRVQRGIGWIARYQRFDDGDGAPAGEPYDRYEMCWGRHTCHMGAAKALKALAEIPPERRTPEVSSTIQNGAEYFLKHHIHKRSHDLLAVSRPGWLKFNFPLMYQTDVLELLLILISLGIKDARMQEALDALLSKQDASGRWKAENTVRGDFLTDSIDRKKWVTLRALKAVKAIGL